MVAVVCGVLVGCQSNGIQKGSELALASANLNVSEKSSEPSRAWQQRIAELKVKQQALREERKERRAARLAKLQAKSGSKDKKAVSPGDRYGNLIAKHAKENGVPLHLAKAVVQVESNFRANATGAAGEIGLMQIKLSTARMMGYRGSKKALYNPETNLSWGMKYLGEAHRLSGGTTCGTILKYNAGHGAKRMNKISSRYCGKVKRILS